MFLRLLPIGLTAIAAVFWAFSPQMARADHDACTQLHEAAFLDEPDEVRDLLDRGANLECLDVLGQTPLITAVNGGSVDSFEILLAAGAKVNVRTEYGRTLLAQAKKKHASFASSAARALRQRYKSIIVRLENAGAVN